MRFRNSSGRGRSWVLGSVLLSLLASAASAQGPAPETAPPLFPGGGLISYNSIFTTRGLISNLSGNIPLTALRFRTKVISTLLGASTATLI